MKNIFGILIFGLILTSCSTLGHGDYNDFQRYWEQEQGRKTAKANAAGAPGFHGTFYARFHGMFRGMFHGYIPWNVSWNIPCKISWNIPWNIPWNVP